MYFDRFDICEAYYLFAMHYHSGGDTTDRIFWRLRRMEFRPAPSLGCSGHDMMGLTENGAMIYNDLIANHIDATGIEPEYLEIVED